LSGARAIGVLGGSFNPPHVAHLAIASDACARLGLERVLFVPAAAPPHKQIDDDVPADMRLAMTKLAIAGDERFEASPVEIELGLRYTADTLAELARRQAGAALVFIVGSDTLLQFETWYEPRVILDLARLAVAPRIGDDPVEIENEAARWGHARVAVLPTVLMDVSSSAIRERVRAGLPIRYLVPFAVERFIAEHALYNRS
jgi:nicotinate-nucleotide adenylyltransferase